MYGWSKYVFLVIMCALAALFILSATGCKPTVADIYREDLIIRTQTGEDFTYQVEIADTPEKSEKGLMFRDSMKENEGMLFYKAEPQEFIMWMKNTKIPLDMLFFDENGVIVNIHDMAKPYSEELIFSIGKVKGVLEINGGQAKKHGFVKGDKIISQRLQSDPEPDSVQK